MQTLGKLYSYYRRYPLICTDTRDIREDCIFFALKGERFNGNGFAEEALDRGARYAVIDEPKYDKDRRYLLVRDVLTTLQGLARYHRNRLNIPVIGITGTNGKTTTKELLHAVLSKKYCTYATKGNLNNHIGVPLTLLSIPESTQIAIVEMGANHRGEIAYLCNIAQPTHGLITNVGEAHLEGFGSFEGVKIAKGELYDYLAQTDGILFIRSDNPILSAMAARRQLGNRISYGFRVDNDVVGRLVAAEPSLRIEWYTQDDKSKQLLNSSLTGSYNIENILAAISVGRHFDVSRSDIEQAIAAYVPQNNRSQLAKTETNTIIRDYYNANASSMTAALENIQQLQSTKKIIILGDMFEMGETTHEAHRKVIDSARSIPLTRRIFVGKAFYKHRDEKDEFYETTSSAIIALQSHPIRNTLVLMKASRGMAFEKLVDLL